MNYPSFIKLIVLTGIYLISSSCSNPEKEMFPNPEIKAGIAKVSGTVINFSLQEGKTKPIINLYCFYPVTSDSYFIETALDIDGNFFFEVPIECSTVFGTVSIPGYEAAIIELSSRKEIKVELKLDSSFRIIRLENATGQSLLTNEGKVNYRIAMLKYINYYSTQQSDLLKVCEMTPEEYAHYEMKQMQARINYAMEATNFSEAGRKFAYNELQLIHLIGTLLSYDSRVEMLCRNKENWSPNETDIPYYSFLKSFELNNPQYIYNRHYIQ